MASLIKEVEKMNDVNQTTQLNILYSHYQESNSLTIESKNRRNRKFLILCILEALNFLILIKPAEAFAMLSYKIDSSLKMSLDIGNNVLQTLLWIIIVYVTIQYIQETLYVERQYTYLSKLENEIQKLSGITVFDREGDNYLDNYPPVLNFIDLFYKMIMPVLFTVINLIRYIRECKISVDCSLALVCDGILLGSLVLITFLFFCEIHPKILSWAKTHSKIISWISEKIRKILKEV